MFSFSVRVRMLLLSDACMVLRSVFLLPVYCVFDDRCLAWWWRAVHLWGREPVWNHQNGDQSQHHWTGWDFLSFIIVCFRNSGSSSKTAPVSKALKRFHIFQPLFTINVFELHFPVEPPLLAQGAPVITTGTGQSLSIPCMLLDGIPLPERHWSQNGKPVRVTSIELSDTYSTLQR